MNYKRSRQIVCFMAAFFIALTPAWACATNQKDLSVALKTFPLLTHKLSGTVPVAVVFDPSSAVSKADADSIRMALGEGLAIPGTFSVSSFMVPTNDLGKLSRARIAFVAEGTEKYFKAIAVEAASSGILTISADIECVKANGCILGVVSSPSVQVYYNKAASDAARIGFSQAFTMLVKQL